MDNTGNLYWPAEEILTYFVLHNLDKIKDAVNVVELGAGKSGLAAFSLIRYLNQMKNLKHIIITDGNPTAI